MFRTTFDKEKKQWNGLKTDTIFNPKTSLGNVILNVLQTNGSRIAQICANTNATTTFDELYDQTIRVAKNLQKFGCQRGEVIFFFTNNSADIPIIVFAALCLGCPVTALGTFNKKRENLHYLNITKPNYVVCDLEHYDQLMECFENLNYQPKFFTFGGQTDQSCSIESLFQQSVSNADSFFFPTEIDGMKEIAFIVRSSGSTGLPKGIQISHASILDAVRRLSSIIKATDVVLALSEIFAITGVILLMAATLNGSTRIVNIGTFSSERFVNVVERFEVTITISTALSIRQILHDPAIKTANLSSYKHYICGGERLSLDIIHKMNKLLKNGQFCNAYGMTETILAIAINVDHQRNDCVGQLLSEFKAKVVNDSGERLGVNEEGEICLKQLFPFLGYLSADENANNCFDSEGFFMTGDIGRFDENGDLFIVDRKKEMFKCGGIHVTPAEIEAFLNAIEGIQQSCLVPIPDPEYDFLPAAVIVKADSSNCTEQSIYDAVSKTFSHQKRLQGGVYFVETIPMTGTGKIARRLVAQMAIELWKKRHNQ